MLGDGNVVISYKDSKFPAAFKTSTIKLSVYLDGNATLDTAKPKANATVSVKVTFG